MLVLLASLALANPFTASLVDSTGATTTLAAAADGQRVVVVVMKAADCPVCVDQLSRLQRDRARLRRLGTVVVGLSAQPSTSADILSDPDHDLLSELGMWRDGRAMPSLFVYDRCREERGRIVGRTPGRSPDDAVWSLLETIASDPETCGRTHS